MGRKKVEMKRIENKSSRQVTFSKRRRGLAKKASEISVLCDLDVAVIVFSNRGKLYEFSHGSSSMESILDQYQSSNREEPTLDPRCIDDSQNFQSAYANLQSPLQLPEIVERDLQDPGIQDLKFADLLELETKFNSALSLTRSRKLQLTLKEMITLREKIAAEKRYLDKATNLCLGLPNPDND